MYEHVCMYVCMYVLDLGEYTLVFEMYGVLTPLK